MPKVKLTLDPPKNENYRPGEELTGTAYFELESTRKINSFFLILKGRAQYYYGEKKTKFRKKQKLCDVKQEIVGETDFHQSGQFSLNFRVNIPENLPSSLFEWKGCCDWWASTSAFIKYSVTLVLDVPWRCKFKDEKKIEIVQNDYLKLMPMIKDTIPFIYNETYDVKTSIFKKYGDMHVKATIPYGAFVRGEKIPILINLKNESDKKFETVEIGLNQNIVSINSIGNVHDDGEFEKDFSSKRLNIDETDGVSEILYEIKVPEDLYLSNVLLCDAVKVVHNIIVHILSESLLVENIKVQIPVTICNTPISMSEEQRSEMKSIFSFYFKN